MKGYHTIILKRPPPFPAGGRAGRPALRYNDFIMVVLYCVFQKGGYAVPVDAPLERIKAGFPGMEAALAGLSRLLGMKKGFSWSARTSRGRLEIFISGAPKGMPWALRWASWVVADALAQADPVLGKANVYGGIIGLDGLCLPAEEIKPVDFPKVIDLSTLGIPHLGLCSGVRALLQLGGILPGQVVAGLKAPLRGAPEALLLSQFSHALFVDPWASGVERLPRGPAAIRVSTRPMPLKPFLLPAYAFAVRSLFRCSLV